jgi:hypothetical protein
MTGSIHHGPNVSASGSATCNPIVARMATPAGHRDSPGDSSPQSDDEI